MSEPSRKPEFLGTCCPELREALRQGSESTFRITDSILYLPIGSRILADVAAGPAGWQDEAPGQAVMFCPFCGKSLQS